VNGCSIVRDITLIEPPQLDATTSVTSDYNGQDISCNGFTDGSAIAQPFDGTGPYTYQWDANAGNQTTQEALNLGAGTYYVTITDVNGCSIVRDITLIEPPQLDATTAVTSDYNGQQISCAGAADAIIITYPIDGTSPYVYQWGATAGNQTTQTAVNIAAGTHFVTITDVNGCSIVRNISVVEPSALSATTAVTSNYNGQHISCFGASDGSALVTASNATPPYIYQWGASAGNQNTAQAFNLPAGIHSVTVTDINGCSVERTVTLVSPIALEASVTVTSNYNGQHVSCYGSENGSALVSPSFGTAPYFYLWDANAGSQTTQVAQNLGAGTYYVTVTDNNGCSVFSSVTLNNPPQLNVQLSVISDYNGQDISCAGYSNGIAQAEASGGTSPYGYQWDAAAGNQLNPTATGLVAGTYTVTVTDLNNCTISQVITLTEPLSLTAASSVVSDYNGQDISCYGAADGSVEVVVGQGTAPYSYLWGANTGYQTTPQVDGLPAGNYLVTITDINGCTISSGIVLTQPQQLAAPLSISSNYNGFAISCYGAFDGSVMANPVHGTPPYFYQWGVNTGSQTTQEAVDIPAGTYVVTVTDVNGCSLSNMITITQPTEITLLTNSQPVICGASLGTATVIANGGASGYTYLWSDGSSGASAPGLPVGEHVVVVTDQNGCSATTNANVGLIGNLGVNFTQLAAVVCYGGTEAILAASAVNGVPAYSFNWSNGESGSTLFDIGAGLYSVTVTDSWGCSGMSTHLITEPSQIVMNYMTSNVSCYGSTDGSATIVTTGGAAPYNIVWGNGASGASASGLAAGTYQVSVTDANTCMMIGQVNITQPEELLIGIVIDSIDCFGMRGAIASVVSGGTGPYNYQWLGPNVNSTQSGIINLAEGVYMLTVTDSHGCSANTMVMLPQPARLTGTYVYDNPSCIGNFDGSITVVLSGGTAPYSSYPGVVDDNRVYLDGLYEGQYQLEITDRNGCELSMGPIVLTDTDAECLRIPIAFSPNGDGSNDTWEITNIELYPGAEINVYNRWGQKLWTGDPSVQWDGTFEGKPLPTGTYLYVIILHNGHKDRVGNVTILY